jgi:UDP-GlcNAc:undecaprenyl-phosphate GlcNAc-1-phosphate transferase
MEEFKIMGVILLFTTLGVFFITPLVKKLACFIGAVDKPNFRKVHSTPMPRLGGVAIFLGFTGALILTQPMGRTEIGLLVGCTVIVLTGIVDDIWDLPPKVKLGAQIVAAGIFVHFGIIVEFITNPFSGVNDVIFLGKLAVPLTILWIIGITNAVNLIDGLDGLAAGTSAIAAITMATVAWVEGQTFIAGFALILAAAVLGFLPYNFHPAKIFMGDSGSMFLGFTLGALAVLGLTKGTAFISVFIPIIILGIPILDTLFAIIRRYRNHRPIFEADKEHLHHRFLEMGFTHRQTVLVIYAIDVFLGVSAVVLNILSTEKSIIALILLMMIISVGAGRIGVFSHKGVSRTERPRLQNPRSIKDHHQL